jgi:uncharacterized RDD family membrane protein YckC
MFGLGARKIAKPDPIAGYARFWRRAVAFGVDLMIVFVLVLCAAMPIYLVGFGSPSEPGDLENVMRFMDLPSVLGLDRGALTPSMIAPLVFWLYEAGMVASPVRGTPGKLVMGLRVERADRSRIGFWRATGRHLARMASLWSLGLGYLTMPLDSRRRALHDIAADVVVHRVRRVR